MKLLLAALTLLPLPALAQVTPTPKLPPANPLPYEDADAAAVLAPINAMFAGLAARDPAAILAQVHPDGSAFVAIEQADGARTLRRLSWQEFTAGLKPGPERMEERLTMPAIEIDGDIAMVWSPYIFLIDGKLSHCGTDHFDLVRNKGRWQVANVTWTQRKTGCPAQ
jgi:hypothetical protein